MALGVLAPDCVSSAAYGTEQMLVELLPVFGLAAFSLVLSITGVVLALLVLLTLSYREVVQVYTKAGGSYVVARENFGPRVAQIAAVALLIDYVVTVAVQTAAGTVAVVSAIPVLGPYSLEITVGVVILLAYGNLRGIREAARAFALPTYLFTGAIAAVVVVGVIRELLGNLPRYDPATLPGAVPVGGGSGLALGVVVLTLARSFANGGSSLTGLEAISNGVSAFRKPEGVNARRVLVVMASTLGFLVAGVSWLAHLTHATPYESGYPSVISQEVRAVFGTGTLGTVLFDAVQAVTALILYTGANTSFNGFPFLASFVAGDSFLPRQLTKRGHRLVFSNGIIVLAVVAIALLVVSGGTVSALVPFYAIGVFTGFTMAGFGMTKYHLTHREAGWRRKLVINACGGGLSLLVVAIFAVVKFTEGAWAVVVLFPILVFALIRLNRQYREEEAALAALAPILDVEPNWARHVVLVFVDTLDLATLRALRYARGLRPTQIRAVHFVLDETRARRLAERWRRIQRGDVGLDLLECRDRRLGRASVELIRERTADGRTEVTVLLPRRVYAPVLGRLLHDRTADHIADRISRVPHAAATIIPFDVSGPVQRLSQAHRHGETFTDTRHRLTAQQPSDDGRRPVASEPEATQPQPITAADRSVPIPISELGDRGPATITGRINSVDLTASDGTPVLTCRVSDQTGSITARFYGRSHIKGVEPGRRIRLHGRPSRFADQLALTDPDYRLLPDEASDNVADGTAER
ncbi:amino acid permease [Pseudonocardia sp. K10HN5]|uniref:Amino acid permease n=2 Tax=Pseudonocardia acidicola TaxID=2724939 RepID=A0ABX1SK70_9PSEU|nr:amino acid permease [Pseudonocardia acidicola]NMI00909.1 amino acid permease [Pseudonocardia acidicola]